MSALERSLTASEPKTEMERVAGVAVVVTDEAESSTLLIKRAERSGDPWSGQVAFPGGKFEHGDTSLRETAVREAKEEVGLDLRLGSEFLGYAGAFRTHLGSMDVFPSVFLLRSRSEINPNEEVTSFKWVPWSRITDPSAITSFRVHGEGTDLEMPALKVDDYVIWGLTHRILTTLLGLEGGSNPLPR